jgi:hypothetical protein
MPRTPMPAKRSKAGTPGMRGVNQSNRVSRTRSGLGLTSGTSATGMSVRRHLPPMTLTEPGGINALA